ncbi:hypothetical protein [Candidatus Burkholderia verschuerenii]|uniref:hypothetical protein n=1 Tax=Candidatus Burkholderia verschuerenii TaxID=242163 RepID=UPI00067E5B26|nr:hypothetical protein [Candidatus Burkholderia verschuerenii]
MGEWKQNSAYGWSHPSGWEIGRYLQNGEEIFMLWHGGETQGRFATLEKAIGRHAELVPQSTHT